MLNKIHFLKKPYLYSLIYILVLGFSFLFYPIISFLISISTFIILLFLFTKSIERNNCENIKIFDYIKNIKNENDESKKRIDSLECELVKASTLEKIKNEKKQIQDELVRATSYNHHLSGLISGLNHEISPWLSGIHMLAHRLNEKESDTKNKDCLKKIEMAIIQTSELLNNLSKSVNKVKNFSVFKSNVKDTVASWIQIVLLERSIKEKISNNNLVVNLESLNFEAEHSPMYVSQVILNLAKNSIDHNAHMLEDLKIKIYGDAELKYLIYEDNGKGIPKELLSKVFNNFGVTTKVTDSGEIHGFGLYSCLNYCLSMKAIIVAQSIPNICTRFIIKFERISKNNDVDDSSSGIYTNLK